MFSGSMVALVTPFKNGRVDWQSLEGLVEFHLQNGTQWDRALRHHGRVGDAQSCRNMTKSFAR